MNVYTVHAPSPPAATLDERAEELVFVREGFSIAAFLLGPFWLAAQRAWRVLGLWLIAFVALQAVLAILPGGASVAGPLTLLAMGAFALEAGTILRWSLERRGFRQIGTAAGRNAEEAEHRFLAGWLEREGAASVAPARTAQSLAQT